MSTAQSVVHSVEQGKASQVIRMAVVGVVVLGIMLIFLLARFRGFNHIEAMDSAQVARQVEAGKGFTTKFIRPLALWQLEKFTGAPVNLGKTDLPDTANAPLPVLLNVLPIKLAGNEMKFPQGVYFPAEERWIAAFSMVFFLAAVAVFFFLARRLFDERLALLGSGLVLVCDLFWEFSVSGLPQNTLLLLFMGALYALERAAEENQAGQLATKWFVVAGGLFGLMELCHGLAIWPFLGLLAFSAAYFKPRGLSTGILALVFLAVITPWLIRNYNVCGNILGIANYSIYDGVKGTPGVLMRSNSLDYVNDVTPMWWRPKIQASILAQFGGLYGLLGATLVAPVFFVALLHPFKRRETAHFRWLILSMWLAAVLGMAIYGLAPAPGAGAIDPLSANQLHVLFIPPMIAFGLAYVLILVSRLEFSSVPLLRLGFMVLLFLVSAFPLITSLLPSVAAPVRFPPYFPPITNAAAKWVGENELIVSDQPWAVAWYGNRKSVWMPIKIADFVTLVDYPPTGTVVAGLFVSPLTGHLKLFPEILRGDYREWTGVILRQPPASFPFREIQSLPPDGEFAFFSDRKRWETAPK